jgi:hypothetical protein
MGLASSKTKIVNNASVAGPQNGATATIHTLTGSGVIRHLHFVANAAYAADVRLQVFTDGNASPDIDVDLGTLFLWHDSFLQWFHYSTLNWHSERSGANQLIGELRFRIPYANGATIKLVAPAGAGAWSYWSNLAYQPGAAPGVRLKSAGVRRASRVTVPVASSYQFVDLAAAGWLVWLGLLEAPTTAGNLSFLERNIRAFIDGEGSPSIEVSGTEDFVGSGFYYDGDTGFEKPWAVLVEGSHSAGNYAQAVDLLAREGGWKFDSHLSMTYPTEAAVTTDLLLAWVALYYQRI